ncbi:Alpha/beta hydrolase domain-containing protein 1 [Elsinoe fawcettii]|nr:Alpha/beta hydrolase domain-containing protein 1 [Elsinoe fawcettii]
MSNRGSVPSVEGFRPKKLIVCCDGTWMNSNSEQRGAPSNVTRLAKRAILPVDAEGNPQVVFYQAGIGTGFGPSSQLLGGGTGRGFSENVREAYSFLAVNYNGVFDLGDKIFLIGFSRGAYTARNLGGLLSQFGLLKKERIDWFYDIFSDWQNAGKAKHKPQFWSKWSQYEKEHGRSGLTLKTASGDPHVVHDYIDEYRTALIAIGWTREVKISAIGVFDTVGALGVPVNPILQKVFRLPAFLHKYMFVDTSLNNNILHAFQALALDEFRAPFNPSIWERSPHCNTNLKQTWFPGAHSSIGGAYSDRDISNITMAWMMDHLGGDEQKRQGTWDALDWLEYDPDYLPEQLAHNLEYQRKRGGERAWAEGAIHDSLTLPHLFTGRIVRKPGRTRPTIPATDFIDETRLLRETNERVHASVRVRIDLGRGFESDPDAGLLSIAVRFRFQTLLHKLSRKEGDAPPYNPREDGPLSHWRFYDGNYDDDIEDLSSVDLGNADTLPYWQYTGRDHLVPKGKKMFEDELGTNEIWLLRQIHKRVIEPVEKQDDGTARRKKRTEGILQRSATR